MNEEVYRKYKKAGWVAAEALKYGIEQIKEGVSYLEIAETVEKKIKDLGAGLAFPVNIAVNDVAAHFTPRHNDGHIFQKGDVVKLDVGAHVDGYIADTAATTEVESDRYSDLIQASHDALTNVIDAIKPNVKLQEIGRIVSETITAKGLKPIDNLSGHSMRRYLLHAGTSIPNVPDSSHGVLKKNEVVAIEPFASTGAGHVISKDTSNIYRYLHVPLVRDVRIRILAKKIKNRFNTLPFAERWCTSFIPNAENNLQRMVKAKCLYSYPQLVDAHKGVVSQHEHTIIVTDDGCEVIT